MRIISFLVFLGIFILVKGRIRQHSEDLIPEFAIPNNEEDEELENNFGNMNMDDDEVLLNEPFDRCVERVGAKVEHDNVYLDEIPGLEALAISFTICGYLALE